MKQPPQDAVSAHEATISQAMAIDSSPDPVVPGLPLLVAMPEVPDVNILAESTPVVCEPRDDLATIVPDVPFHGSKMSSPVEVDAQGPQSCPAIDTSIPPWGDPMSPLSLFGMQESQPPIAQKTNKPTGLPRVTEDNEKMLRRSSRATAKSKRLVRLS